MLESSNNVTLDNLDRNVCNENLLIDLFRSK